jgi:hypothetical protein
MQSDDRKWGAAVAGEGRVERLISKMCTDERWRQAPLGTLMPGIERARAPLQEGWLSTRAVNGLGRAGVRSWPDLATMSPSSLSGIPNLGPKSVREILSAAVEEWTGPTKGASQHSVGRLAGSPRRRRGADLNGAFEDLEGHVPDFEIFRRHRLVEDGAPTLQELGDELGVSRERIRQRESHMRDLIARRMADEDWPIRIAVDQLTRRVGGLALCEGLPALFASIDPGGGGELADAPHRQALLLHLGGYSISGVWVQSNDLDTRTDALLWALTQDSPVVIEDVVRELDAFGIRRPLRVAWLESRADFRVFSGLVGRKCDALENAVGILEEARRPLEISELLARTTSTAAPATFRERLHHDKRFLRCGVRHYGLREWGGEEFTTIAEKMEASIEQSGGGLDLDVLARSLVERFGVAGASVRKKARTPRFAIDSVGRVSRQVGGFAVPRAPLVLTRHCFHLDQGWALKLTVTEYLLHGANSRMPLSFARAIGLQVATSATYASRFGDLGACWPRYAASAGRLGSLRIATRNLHASEGDRLFVVFIGGGEVDFKLVEKSRCEAVSGPQRLALECGLEPGDEPLTQVLSALGLDPHLSDPEATIRARLSERHEAEMIGSLSSALS